MAIFSAVIWMLEEPTGYLSVVITFVTNDLKHRLDLMEGHTGDKSDRSCLALRETTYDLKLD